MADLEDDANKKFTAGGLPDTEPDYSLDPKHRQRNPVLILFVLIIALFFVGILAIIFFPGILDKVFGNN
jgi:hypothetical protein